jgi:hypothetical protein
VLVLFDENLPHRLRFLIPGHELRTVAFQGWNALTNGALLKAAEQAGFDVLLTADQAIRYQQNIQARKIAVVILSSNELSRLVTHANQIVAAINSIRGGTIVAVDLGS